MILRTVASIACLAAASPLAAEPPKPAATEATADPEFDAALECRGYTQMLSALGDPEAGRRIHRYWVDRSNELGAKRGLTAEQTDFRHLLIPITAEKAKPVLLRCVNATPKKASGLK